LPERVDMRLTRLHLVLLSTLALDACSCTSKQKLAPAPPPLFDAGSAPPQAGPALDAGAMSEGERGSADHDAGIAQTMQIACPRGLLSCNVRGRVRSLEAGTTSIPQPLGRPITIHGLVFTVDTTAPPDCPFPS
jgi:hypothetical protein